MNIVLCGFMGCGKTTVGKRLAKELDRGFYDTDEMIVKSQNLSISDIFKKYSENGFREIEKNTIKQAATLSNAVIATGGGAILNAENAEALHSTGIIVFIDVDEKTVINRLKNSKSRPLLQRPDREQVIKEMLCERRPKYLAAADITVISNNQSANSVVKQIINALKDIEL